MGLTKTIQFILDYWGTSRFGIGVHPEALEGSVQVGFVLRGEEAEKSFGGEIWKWAGRGPLKDMNEVYLAGAIWGGRFERALEIALKAVGYDKLDSRAFAKAKEKLTGFDHFGVAGPCTYSEKERSGTRTVKFYKVVKGKQVPITDWMEVPNTVVLHKW